MRTLIYFFAQLLRRLGVNFREENDPRVQAMQEAIKKLGSIRFHIEVLPDGSWAAESTNIDGIITGGTDKESINAMIKDAIFTYFGIPPQLCNDSLMKSSDEPLKLEQRVYA